MEMHVHLLKKEVGRDVVKENPRHRIGACCPDLEKDDKENVTINIEMMETIPDDVMESIFQEKNVNNDISSMVEVVRYAKIEVAKNTCPPL